MRTLYILRHAKSSWADTSLSDFDRPLNDRGNRAAPFMGELMTQKGLEPSIILSSPAVRAKNTALLVKKAGNFPAEIIPEDKIYESSPQRLREIVSQIDDTHQSAMIVGHNPGMEGFIRLLTGSAETMSTAALAVIELKINNWDEIIDGCGELLSVYRPKDEMK